MKFNIDFNKEEITHIKFMSKILNEIHKRNLPLYLKGGTSLLLCYDLDRFSEDIDLNAKKKFNLESIINTAAKSLNIEIKEINIHKDTDTTKRYKVKYEGRGKALKIEISFRDNIQEEDATIINNIKVYKIDTLIKMKISALLGRTASRDFFDVNFLLTKYLDEFSKEQIDTVRDFLNNEEILIDFLGDFGNDDILDEDDFSTCYENMVKIVG